MNLQIACKLRQSFTMIFDEYTSDSIKYYRVKELTMK